MCLYSKRKDVVVWQIMKNVPKYGCCKFTIHLVYTKWVQNQARFTFQKETGKYESVYPALPLSTYLLKISRESSYSFSVLMSLNQTSNVAPFRYLRRKLMGWWTLKIRWFCQTRVFRTVASIKRILRFSWGNEYAV